MQLVRTAEDIGWEDVKMTNLLQADEVLQHGGITINSQDHDHREFLASSAFQHHLDVRFKMCVGVNVSVRVGHDYRVRGGGRGWG